MLEIVCELAAHDSTDEELTSNYGIEFLLIARAMNGIGPGGMWDEDGFYYDVLRLPDGNATRLKVRSMVGLLPLCATTAVEKWQRDRLSRLNAALAERVRRMPELRESIHETGPGHLGVAERASWGSLIVDIGGAIYAIHIDLERHGGLLMSEKTAAPARNKMFTERSVMILTRNASHWALGAAG
jgi:hypothetical protein